MYKKLEEKGDQAAAIHRAEKLRLQHRDQPPSQSNPCTLVDELVKMLNRHLIKAKK
jgi:hypothetical protein